MLPRAPDIHTLPYLTYDMYLESDTLSKIELVYPIQYPLVATLLRYCRTTILPVHVRRITTMTIPPLALLTDEAMPSWPGTRQQWTQMMAKSNEIMSGTGTGPQFQVHCAGTSTLSLAHKASVEVKLS